MGITLPTLWIWTPVDSFSSAYPVTLPAYCGCRIWYSAINHLLFVLLLLIAICYLLISFICNWKFSYHGHSSDRKFFIVGSRASHWAWSTLIWLVWLVNELWKSAHLLPLWHWGYRCHHIWLFRGYWESHLRSLPTTNKAISPGSPLSTF